MKMTAFQKIMHTMDYLADGMADILRTGKFNDKVLSFDTEHAKSNYNVYKSRYNTVDAKDIKTKELPKQKAKSEEHKVGFLKNMFNKIIVEPTEKKRLHDVNMKNLERYYENRNKTKEQQEPKQEVKQEPKQSVFKTVNAELAKIANSQKSLSHVANAELAKIASMQNQAKEAEKTREDKTRTPGEQFVMKHGIKDEKQIEQLGKRADDYIVEGHEKIENFTNRSGMDKGLDTMERSLNQTEKNAPDHAQQMEM